MSGKISVVINTLNEAKLVETAVKSVSWADEVLICDMHSEDNIDKVAKKYKARFIQHERVDFVEPARNRATAKASNEWVLILDPDEEVSPQLASRLRKIAREGKYSFVEIPRKNIIFGKWMTASFWWPDYNIRFFKKGQVIWPDEIHRKPRTWGEGLTLPSEEEYSLIHHHYNTVAQFIFRLDRYTTVQARELVKSDYRFKWQDLITKPLAEFLGRFFANHGFRDGLHGLALSLLQAFSFLVVYLKVWEAGKFATKELEWKEIKKVTEESGKEIAYWLKYGNLSSNSLKRLWQRVVNKLT